MSSTATPKEKDRDRESKEKDKDRDKERSRKHKDRAVSKDSITTSSDSLLSLSSSSTSSTSTPNVPVLSSSSSSATTTTTTTASSTSHKEGKEKEKEKSKSSSSSSATPRARSNSSNSSGSHSSTSSHVSVAGSRGTALSASGGGGGGGSNSSSSTTLAPWPEQPSSPLSSTSSKDLDPQLEDLEHKLKIELDIRAGAENLYRNIVKKKDKEMALQRLEESSKSVEKLREKIATLKNQQMARVGQSHSGADLLDMMEETTLTEAEMEAQKELLENIIEREMKVKAGAENLAKVYGANATSDKKLINQVFTKLLETNSKIALLKVAVKKYESGLSLLKEGKLLQRKSNTGAGIMASPSDGTDLKKMAPINGKLRVTIQKASKLAPPHKKLDIRCEIKIDNVTKAKTSVKQKVNEAVWNDDFTLDLRGVSDIEFHFFDDKSLYAILFFDVRHLTEEPQSKVLLLEPRGEISLSWTFVKSATEKGMHRRGAVKKPRLPRAFMEFLGYQATMEMATKLQHEQSNRRREERLTRSKSFRQQDMEILSKEEFDKAQKRRVPSVDDFVLIKVLGKGNFGKVMLVEEKSTKNIYAIKVLKKEFVIENDEIDSVKAEKKVFQIANRTSHPFLVKLHSCFQTKDRIFFVMEYVSGGDLMMHIQRAIFPETRAKMYACEVLLALEYLHSHDIIYRDLKLDNILLGLDGHVKVADYGLCKENMKFGATTNTFCGTPEFMAPEILLEKPYTRAVDWWAFGVLVYELLLAQSPFKGEEEEQIFDSILDSDVYYPSRLNPDAVDLLQKLLERDPSKRLGAGSGDAADVKAHPYFKTIDWKAVLEKRIEPNFKPTVSSSKDTNNFDPEFTREVPCITPSEVFLDDVDQEEFVGFSYVADWADMTTPATAAATVPTS